MLPCTAALFGRGPGGRERGGKRGRENKSIVPLAAELKNCLQLGCFPKVLCHRLAQSLNVSSNSRSAKGIKTISKSQKQTNKIKTNHELRPVSRFGLDKQWATGKPFTCTQLPCCISSRGGQGRALRLEASEDHRGDTLYKTLRVLATSPVSFRD